MAGRGGGNDWQAERDLAAALSSTVDALEKNTEALGGGAGSPGGGSTPPGGSPRSNDALQMAIKSKRPTPGLMSGFGPGLRATSGGRAAAMGASSLKAMGGALGSAGGVAGLSVGVAVRGAHVAGEAFKTFADDTVTMGEKKARFTKYLASTFGGSIGSNVMEGIHSATGLARAERIDRSTRSSFRGFAESMVGLGLEGQMDDDTIKSVSGAFRKHKTAVERIMTKQKALGGATGEKMDMFTEFLLRTNPALEKFTELLGGANKKLEDKDD